MKDKGEIDVYIVKNSGAERQSADIRKKTLMSIAEGVDQSSRRQSFIKSIQGSFMAAASNLITSPSKQPVRRQSIKYEPSSNGLQNYRLPLGDFSPDAASQRSMVSVASPEYSQDDYPQEGIGQSSKSIGLPYKDNIDEMCEILNVQHTFSKQKSAQDSKLTRTKSTLEDKEFTDAAFNKMNEFYETKMFSEYSSNINISLLILLTDSFTSEFIIWLDNSVPEKSIGFRFANFVVALLITILLLIIGIRKQRLLFKWLVFLCAFGRLAMNNIELWSMYLSRKSYAPATLRYRIPHLNYNINFIAMIDGIFPLSVGVLTFRQVVLTNLVILVYSTATFQYFQFANSATLLLATFITFLFNSLDGYKFIDTEHRSFFQIVTSNRKSSLLTKFVERMLPKNVSSTI